MNIIIDKLRNELEDANALEQKLRSQTENYARTIKDITLERKSLISSTGELHYKLSTLRNNQQPTQVKNNKELLIEARKFINNPIIDGHKTRKETVNKVVEVVKEAIIKTNDQIYEMCRYVKQYMDNHYIGDWSVYIWYNNIGYIWYNGISDAIVEVKFGKVTVVIFKTYDAVR